MKLISVDVFNLDVAVFTSDRARVKHLRKEGCEPDKHDPAAIASSHLDITKEGDFRLSFVIKPHASKATLAHECSHMADFICNLLGIPISLKNTEIRAYLVQHLFAALEEQLESDK